MKIENYQFPKSSFLSTEKDMEIIINLMLKNERLQKLLFHTTNKALNERKLTEDEKFGLINKNIKIVPKFLIDKEALTYIIVSFDNFSSNAMNPVFRDNTISFDIICHFDQWKLQDFQLRPYKIAAEIDSMLANQRLTGIGEIQFLGAKQIILNDEFGGLSLVYSAIHGEEDKKFSLNPKEQDDINFNFNRVFNE